MICRSLEGGEGFCDFDLDLDCTAIKTIVESTDFHSTLLFLLRSEANNT